MISFSVIIPLYNKEHTIRQTLESVLQQSYPHFELIVVDDGSRDRSLQLVQELTDERIRIYAKTNGGPGSARNLGLQKASFDWAIWLDADDQMLPGALETFATIIGEHPDADMVVGNFQLNNKGNTCLYQASYPSGFVNNAFRAWFLKELMPCAGTYACRKEFLSRHPYREELLRSEDTEVLFHLFREVKIFRIDAVVMCYCRDFSLESHKKTALAQDYEGNLDFDSKKSLWEGICLYELYIEAKNNYPAEVDAVYPDMRRHLPLRIAYHSAFWYRALHRRINR